MPSTTSVDGRFHSPLLEPDLPISVIRLSDGIRSRYSRWSAGKGGQGGHTKLAEDVLPRIPARPGRADFAATHQEATNAIFDEAIKLGAHSDDGTTAEVISPSPQSAVQGSNHVR